MNWIVQSSISLVLNSLTLVGVSLGQYVFLNVLWLLHSCRMCSDVCWCSQQILSKFGHIVYCVTFSVEKEGLALVSVMASFSKSKLYWPVHTKWSFITWHFNSSPYPTHQALKLQQNKMTNLLYPQVHPSLCLRFECFFILWCYPLGLLVQDFNLQIVFMHLQNLFL